MLKSIEPFTERKLGENCVTQAISNILNYKEMKDHKFIWKQCGMMYIKHNEELKGTLVPKYFSTEQELQLIHGINFTRSSEDTADKFIEAISSIILRGEPVIIYVDPYELEYNMFYQNRHDLHCVTLIDVDFKKRYFTAVDDYYVFKGNISFDEVIKAANIEYGRPIIEDMSYTYITISIDRAREPENLNGYLDIIKRNNEVLSGVYPEKTIRVEGNIGNVHKLVIGLEGIVHFKEESQYYLEKFDLLTLDVINSTYRVLANVSNSRYLYSHFLSNLPVEHHGVEEYYNKYLDLGQDWKVAANMLIKGMIKNQVPMYQRMIEKVEKIYSKEQDALKFGEELLQDIQSLELI